MVGYTPSVSTAVWVGTDTERPDQERRPGGPMFGRMLPGSIWQTYMNGALRGTPPEQFSPFVPIGHPARRRLGRVGRVATTRTPTTRTTTTRTTTTATPTATASDDGPRIRRRRATRRLGRRRPTTTRTTTRQRLATSDGPPTTAPRSRTPDRRARLPERAADRCCGRGRQPGRRRGMSPPPDPEPAGPPAGSIPTWTEPLAGDGQPGRRRPARPARRWSGAAAFWTPLRVVLLLAVVVLAARLAGQGAVPAAVRHRRRRARAGLAQQPPVRRDVLLRHRAALRHRGARRGARAVPRLVGRGRGHAHRAACATWSTRCSPGSSSTPTRGWPTAGSWLAAQRAVAAHRAAGGRLLRHLRVLAGAGLAGGGVGGARGCGPARPWDAALVALLPAGRGARLHQLRRAGRGCATAGAAGAAPAGGRCSPGCCSGVGGAFKLYPLMLLLPVVLVGRAPAGPRRPAVRAVGGRGRRPGRRSTRRSRWPGPGGLVGVLPAQPHPPGRPRLAVLRRQLLHRLGRASTASSPPAQAPVVLNTGQRGAVRRCAAPASPCSRCRAPQPAAARLAGVPGGRGVPAGEQGVEPAVLAVAGAAGRARAAALAAAAGVDDASTRWCGCRGCTTTSAPSEQGLPPDWFLGAVVVRDASWCAVRAGGAHRAAAGDGPGPYGWPGGDDPDWPARGADDRAAGRRPAGAQLVRTLAGTR